MNGVGGAFDCPLRPISEAFGTTAYSPSKALRSAVSPLYTMALHPVISVKFNLSDAYINAL
jgi:hypothetical protein